MLDAWKTLQLGSKKRTWLIQRAIVRAHTLEDRVFPQSVTHDRSVKGVSQIMKMYWTRRCLSERSRRERHAPAKSTQTEVARVTSRDYDRTIIRSRSLSLLRSRSSADEWISDERNVNILRSNPYCISTHRRLDRSIKTSRDLWITSCVQMMLYY